MTDLVKLTDLERWKKMEEVAELKFQGLGDLTVARQLNLKMAQVKELHKDYRETLAKDSESRDRARDQLNLMVRHYDLLIKKLYDLIDELEQENLTAAVAAQRLGAVKQIGEFESRRVELMQRAGVLDANDLGDELAKMEEQRDVILDVLRHELCPACRAKVMQRITAVSNQAEVVVVYD